MQIKRTILRDILSFFIPLLYIEIVFHLIAFDSFDVFTFLRIILFTMIITFIYNLIFIKLKHTAKKWIIFAIVLIFAIYAFAELEFKNFLDNYYSLSAVSDGATRIKDYVFYFIKDAKIEYYLTFIAPVIILIMNIKLTEIEDYEINLNIIVHQFAIIFFSIIILCMIFNGGNNILKLSDTYKMFNNTELLLNKIGLNHFLYRDISALFIDNDASIMISETPNPTQTTDTTSITKTKTIDDSRWKKDIEKEENEKIKNIDNYLINQNIDYGNEMTGIFKGYNMIYILVESFDYIAIDKDLTPTLYMMMNNSLFFDNHYTPKFSCTTGESEFIAMTSLVPFNDVCTPNYVTNNAYPEALSNLFKNEGYNTYSFHNWYDQYYNRRDEHKAWGIDEYYDVYDLDISFIQGWQSDVELIEKASEHFISSEPFFSLIISSSMHWPYDSNSNLGDKYMSEINKIHDDYPIEIKRYLSKSIEFDRAMERLIEILKENDLYDSTVISLFSDHHPLKLPISTIQNYSFLKDRYSDHGEDLTPFIIYNPNVESKFYSNIMSTFDQTPTLANLFGLNYDSRLYIGNDIFSKDATVIFPNGDWITEKGIFISSKNSFSGNDDNDYIITTTKEVQNSFNVSYLIMNNDYFKNRFYLANPVYKIIKQ